MNEFFVDCKQQMSKGASKTNILFIERGHFLFCFRVLFFVFSVFNLMIIQLLLVGLL